MSAAGIEAVRLRPGVTLYIVRHGETDWNAECRYQGQEDIPLNVRGRLQAKRNGEALKVHLGEALLFKEVDFISSPLSRARETMAILRTAMGLSADEFDVDPLLREIHYGHWQGQLARDLPRFDPEGAAARAKDPFNWQPKGGESYAGLMARTDAWLAAVQRDTVAVTHGGVMRTLRGRLLACAPAEIPRLEVPQDRVLLLQTGAMSWL